MRLFSRIILALGILLSLNVKSESDVHILVDGAINSAEPIVVVPFRTSGNVPVDVAQIISDDLRNSGKFSPISREKLPAQPGSAGEVIPEQWSVLGADNVVVGQVSANGGSYNVAYN